MVTARTRFYRHKRKCSICGYNDPEWQVGDCCFIGKKLWEKWRDEEKAKGKFAPVGRCVDG